VDRERLLDALLAELKAMTGCSGDRCRLPVDVPGTGPTERAS